MGNGDMHQAVLAVITLEAKRYLSRDHAGVHTLSQADCTSAGQAVDAARPCMFETIRSTLMYRIEQVEAWLAQQGR